MTHTQRSKLTLLGLLFLPVLALPVLAGVVQEAGDLPQHAALLNAPPPVLLVALGLSMVGLAVGRHFLKRQDD